MSETATGLCLNEDNSHYFFSRAGKALDEARVASWVDQYAGTQVKELFLCPNSMRTSYASAVWDPIWRGYDPAGPDDQPLLASLPPEGRVSARRWIHTAWKLHQDGIDPYALWIRRAREKGISPWISVRMNDVHNADDERCYIHSEFWRTHPHLRRVPYRFAGWNDRALDYRLPEVREYHLALIRELIARYDFDGLELDWMRFGFHFAPGHEAEGAERLTEFTATVRGLLDRAGRRRGRRLRLSARVPSRPQTAIGLGMDALQWARRRLIDQLVVTPFWASAETDMPIELWKDLLHGTRTRLAAGLEVLLRPSPSFPRHPMNSLETVRGAAASLLHRGADRIYLFNYMDSETAMDGLADYPTLLREAGQEATLAGKPRRHVVTFSDTWAVGEPAGYALPANLAAGAWAAFRLHIGPKPDSPAVVRLGIEEGAAPGEGEVRVNGQLCRPVGAQTVTATDPGIPLQAYAVPARALAAGYQVIEVQARQPVRIGWVELAITT